MIEVFKTNMDCPDQAERLISLIHQSFPRYKANFDLDDCDRVLRVVCTDKQVDVCALIQFLTHWDCHAEVLPDLVLSGVGSPEGEKPAKS